MSIERLTGSRIREKRLDLGLRQAAVAEAVGISASYLNLIEHNRRRIGGKLLADIARKLGVETSQLTADADGDLLDQIRAAAGAFGTKSEVDRAEELSARFPGWSKLIAAQANRLAMLEERVQALTDRMSYDPQLAMSLNEVVSAATSIRSSASILVGQEDLDADWQRRFHENIHADSLRLGAGSEALISYLDAPDADVAVVQSPQEEIETFLATSSFHYPQLEKARGDVDAFVAGVNLSPPASALLRMIARIYQSDAVAMPRRQFAQAAQDCAYDPAALSQAFAVDFAAVLRRFATLSPSEGHPQTGLAVVDASGSVTFLKTMPGFRLPRFGGACPLWPIFSAFSRPTQPIMADIVMPGTDQTGLRCYAVADAIERPGFDRPPALRSTMLVLPDLPADSRNVIPVGVSCRICPRARCNSRREPAMDGVTLDTSL
ncbi:hypothetical protein DFP92_101479 [Yoonia sediminilitoris]|uniref:HTH cro/C1-type domain-containing protein n=1 Tax=Yoonia sediminilitoris TaxID=1286148 RepID=A0A2T6KQQ8_9RHOB|nr:hypothetical protein C8N45_101479 [Yoonia sediminilitoris]RCW99056.1 hypothetical protein DFP92_101479 [Yoonia sediminilitoris]